MASTCEYVVKCSTKAVLYGGTFLTLIFPVCKYMAWESPPVHFTMVMGAFLFGVKGANDEYEELKKGESDPIGAFVFALFTGGASKVLGAPYYAAATIGLIGYKIYKGEAKELVPIIIRQHFGK